MKRTILSVSSSRADLGALAPVWRALAAMPEVALHVVLTGMHRGEGGDAEAASQSVPEQARRHQVGRSIGGGDALASVHAMADIMTGIGNVIAETRPDVMLIMGDRLDMAPAALAAVPFNIPLAHLHGGELTFGAIDDRLRHAMSKLAHIHFVSGVDAADRLVRMGEVPTSIHITGAPGLDALAAAPAMSREAFLSEIGLPDGRLRLVTVHSETNAKAPLAAAEAVISAIEHDSEPALITAANADMGGQEINRRMRALAASRPRTVFRDTLGSELYANALRHSAVMLGNSSSGLVEAGLFGLSVINVGGRQDGRLRGLNVRDVPADAARVSAALSAAPDSRYDPADVSLYGDARAAPRVADALAHKPDLDSLLRKPFHADPAEFSVPWSKVQNVRGPASTTAEDSGTLVTRSTITSGLGALGIIPGDIILVHTALSALGFVAGGARTIVEGLIETVGEAGSVVMPTFTGDLSDPAGWRYPPVPPDWIERIRTEIPPYDPFLSPTRRMGAVAELFRSWPGTLRSSHPQSSFAARGPKAEEIVSHHPLDFRFGPNSPLARLEGFGARVVMLGAPDATLSAFYRTQADSGDTSVRHYRSPVDIDGSIRWVEWQDHAYSQHWFGDAVVHLGQFGLSRTGTIGQARVLVLDLATALPAVRAWRKAHSIA